MKSRARNPPINVLCPGTETSKHGRRGEPHARLQQLRRLLNIRHGWFLIVVKAQKDSSAILCSKKVQHVLKNFKAVICMEDLRLLGVFIFYCINSARVHRSFGVNCIILRPKRRTAFHKIYLPKKSHLLQKCQ